MADGPRAAYPMGDQGRTVVRRDALQMAVEVVRNTQQFTTFQVVQTAQLFEQYIADGKVPPISSVPIQANVTTTQPKPLQENDNA